MSRIALLPEAYCEDLTRVFLQHTRQAATTAERVAYALRRAFVAESIVVVITEDSDSSARICGSAECTALDGAASAIQAEVAQGYLEDFKAHRARASWPRRAVAPDHIDWWVSREAPDGVFFGLGWSFGNDRVTIYSRLTGALEAELARDFDQSVSLMELFANAVRSRHLLECTQKAEDLRASFRGRLDTLLHPMGPKFSDGLNDLVDLLHKISYCTDLGARDDLHCQILRFANMALNRLVQRQAPYDPAVLADASDGLRRLSEHASLGKLIRREFELLAECVDALRSDTEGAARPVTKAAELETRHQALSLLAASIRAYRQASSGSDASLDKRPLLQAFFEHVRSKLPLLLVAWGNPGIRKDDAAGVSRDADGVRSGLRLWLVLDVVCAQGAQDIKRAQIPETMLALALVLRDGIRHRLYQGTPGFEIDTMTLTQTLQDVVVLHALLKNKNLQDVGLEQHLRNMEASGFGRWNADGHQSHVLDVYMTGNFLLDLRVGDATRSASESSTVSAMLANSGPQGEADLRAAFCLAALFHDAGMLLFPFVSHPESSPIEGMKAIEGVCSIVQQQVASLGKSLVEACIGDLEADKQFNPDERWQPWLERQRKRDRPEHELLGAWFLRMACSKARNLPHEISRTAVRATLLHGALGVKLDLAKDAVAALLILCDELCDWYPARKPPPDRRDLGRRLNDQSVHRRARQGRARELELLDLWVRAEDGRLVAGIAPPPETPQPGTGWPTKRVYWPRFEIGLRAPGELDVAVLEIWLRSAQNLGRISCTNQRWAPAVKITSAIPERLKDVQRTTRELLDELANELDPTTISLHGWLGESELFSAVENLQPEAVYLVPDAGPVVDDHIVVCMCEILSRANTIVEHWEKS